MDIVIAAKGAASGPGESSGGVPIGGINAVRKGGWIIATGNASTASGNAKNPRA